MKMFKNYFKKKNFYKIIESLRISEQILGDPHATACQCGVPTQYIFNIDTEKEHNLNYKDYNLNEVIKFLKDNDDFCYFKYHDTSYSVSIKDNIDYKRFNIIIWVNPEDI